jgi:flagellar basal body rod protein FlgC
MSFSIGLSGLNAATRRLDAAAFEVARTSAQVVGRPPAAEEAAPAPAAGPAAGPPARPVAPPRAADAAAPAEPDLPRAMVDMISASNAFLANLQTIRRTDENLRALLDAKR